MNQTRVPPGQRMHREASVPARGNRRGNLNGRNVSAGRPAHQAFSAPALGRAHAAHAAHVAQARANPHRPAHQSSWLERIFGDRQYPGQGRPPHAWANRSRNRSFFPDFRQRVTTFYSSGRENWNRNFSRISFPFGITATVACVALAILIIAL